MKALFYCQASESIGMGHVMRCLTFANFLASKGWCCSFLCSEETLKIVSSLKYSKFKIISDQKKIDTAYDIVFFDDYGVDKNFEKQFRKHSNKIVVFDDLANREHDCDILVDQTYGYDKSRYKNLVPENCEILAGAEYIILRPEFVFLRKLAIEKSRSSVPKISNVLVSIGGTDPQGVTLNVLRSIEDLPQYIQYNVILNNRVSNYKKVEDHYKILKKKGIKIELHSKVEDMAQMMLNSDLAVGASGTTTWERCCVGLPTLTIQTADNQKFILEKLNQEEIIIFLGASDKINNEVIKNSILDLIKNPSKLKSMQHKSFEICDGRGINRIFPHMLKDEGVSLRCMSIDDLQTLFRWQQKKVVRQYARNPQSPTIAEHKNWFTKALSDSGKYLYMIEYNQKQAGMLRLDRRADCELSYEVSILLDPKFHGQGIARKALKIIRKLEIGASLWAEIHPDNKASQSLFCHLGYQQITQTWFKNG
ncbi:MAG: UDP-2,4-diacetamido-2,4,6-trideoxy-beta-L-altropyranose hydrolase [Alphaproteobacteria bacterium]